MESYDLIICVFACDTIPKYREQLLKMNETYGDILQQYTNIKILYFLGEEITDIVGEQYIRIKGVQNDILSASYKQYFGMKYICENYNTKFVMCIGTDTYINIKKIDIFLKTFNPNDNLYIGGHTEVRFVGRQVYYFSGGSGFILSKKCLEKIYPKLHSFMEEWIQICINHGVQYLIGACDVGIAYLVTSPEISSYYVDCGGLLFTSCNHKGMPSNKYTCPELIISCHYMNPTDFDEFTELLKKNNYFI